VAPRSRRVVWATAARTALDEVVEYIARDSRESALKVLTRALETAESLSALPERGRVVPELSDPAIRELFVHRYRMLYRIFDDVVVVVAFLHGARDFAAWRRSQSEP
jgi:plasmid stabilization system protein ParE